MHVKNVNLKFQHKFHTVLIYNSFSVNALGLTKNFHGMNNVGL